MEDFILEASYVIGNVIIGLGVLMVLIGLYGFYRYKDFYSKLLATATIDTMGLVTVLIGAIIRGGLSWFSLKVVFILALTLVLNPVATSKITLNARNNEVVKEEERLAAEEREKAEKRGEHS